MLPTAVKNNKMTDATFAAIVYFATSDTFPNAPSISVSVHASNMAPEDINNIGKDSFNTTLSEIKDQPGWKRPILI